MTHSGSTAAAKDQLRLALRANGPVRLAKASTSSAKAPRTRQDVRPSVFLLDFYEFYDFYFNDVLAPV